jgi:glycosyltransferase involved in cell wall biosynthesis
LDKFHKIKIVVKDLEVKMKKLLLLTYYWPPSGGPGVQRWLKFVKFLPEFGWQPTVITTRDGDYPALDTSLLKEVPDTVEVIRTYTPNIGRIFKKVSGNAALPYGSLQTDRKSSIRKKILFFLRLNFVIPDLRKLWNRYAYKAAKAELQKENYDLLVSTGPPHSTHLIAAKLTKKFSIKWLADFRDPWSEMSYLKTAGRLPITEFFDKKLEAKVLRQSDIITVVSQKIKADFNNLEKIKVLHNGFDEDDFTDIYYEKSEKFQINYFGSLTNETNPLIVLTTVNELIESGKNKFEMNFWGNYLPEMQAKIQAKDKFKIVNFHGYLPHSQILVKMVNSQLLLLIINKLKNNKGILTGKIFEYLGSRIPILGLGPTDGEAASILQETGSGKMFPYDDKKNIYQYIRTLYENWQNNRVWQSASASYLKYSRRNLTKQLIDIIE